MKYLNLSHNFSISYNVVAYGFVYVLSVLLAIKLSFSLSKVHTDFISTETIS